MTTKTSYAGAGVDVAAGNAFVETIRPLIARTARSGVMKDFGGFAGAFDLDATGYDDPILLAASDGVGTKVKIAAAVDEHATIGIDLVAMCVNDLVVRGAEPLFFLDYLATGRLVPAVAEEIVRGIADGCRVAGCALIGGETAEMPGLYRNADYDLAGFAVGAAERGAVLPYRTHAAGDILIGLGASGLHANGFSLVRKYVADAGLSYDDPAPFDNDSGAAPKSLGQALLAPTRIYVRAVLDVLRQTGGIKALAHITGGGMGDNLARVLPDHLAAQIDLAAVAVPPVISWLARSAGLSRKDLLTAFNCGIGMIAVVEAASAPAVRDRFRQGGETCTVLGRLVERTGNAEAVTFTGHLQLKAGA